MRPPYEQLELPFDLSDVRIDLGDEEALRAAVRLSIEGRGAADLSVANIERAVAAARAPSAAARQAPRRGAAAATGFADGAADADAGAETAAELRLEREGELGGRCRRGLPR